MFSFHLYDSPLFIATNQLLRVLGVKVSSATLINTLEEHPDYPSMLSIMDSLETWKVETMGINITYDRLINLPLPALVHFKSSKLFLVTEVGNNSITYLNEKNKKALFSKKEFLDRWDGIVLLAAPLSSPQSGEIGVAGEQDYYKKRRKEILQKAPIPAGLVIISLLLTLAGITGMYNDGVRGLFPFLLSIVMLAGVIVSGLLLWYEIDSHNPLLQKICTAGKHTNCSAILQSGAAKLWGFISWSEVGFAYFTGGFLSLLLSDFNPAIVEVIAWLNLLAIPYIFFSLFYQWRVAKQWCVLCLTVQSSLLAGFIICLTGKYYTVLPLTISVKNVTLLIISYLLPLSLWKQVKPLWLKAREGRQYKLQLLRLKHDPRIFEALLPKQKNISAEEIQTLGITLGHKDSKYKIVKVCNPYCGPCARAHPEIDKILEMNPDVSAQIIFTATDDEKDIKSYPAKHLMAIDEKGDKDLTKKALDDWYGAQKKDYDSFANKYPLNGELKQQGEKLKAMSEWCEKTEISFTPTFFVFSPSPLGEGRGEGYQLPNIYGIEDLKYLLR